MSIERINAIISRVATDREYRNKFFSDFDAAVAGYNLTPDDRAVLRQLTPRKIESMTLTLKSWGEPAGSASLELMRFLDERQDERTVYRDTLKTRARRNQRLLIGVIVLAVVLVAAGVWLGMSLGQPQGPPSAGTAPAVEATPGAPATSPPASGACPCTCTEDCPASGGLCITVCADCNGDRCVPE